MGFVSLKFDSNVYRKGDVLISTYVDDFMILVTNDSQINEIIRILGKALNIKDLSEMSCFLSINIVQNDGIRIN